MLYSLKVAPNDAKPARLINNIQRYNVIQIFTGAPQPIFSRNLRPKYMGRVLQNLCVLENRSTLLGVEVERQLTKFFMMTPSREGLK